MVFHPSSTNGQAPHRPNPQEIVDAEVLDDLSTYDVPPPPKPLNGLGLSDAPQQFQQFEQRLSRHFQIWQGQQAHRQHRDRVQQQRQFQTFEEQTQLEFHRLHNHLTHLERKLDYTLRERQLESKRRSIFVLLAIFVGAIAYITVVYPLMQRPKVRLSPPTPQTVPQQARPQAAL